MYTLKKVKKVKFKIIKISLFYYFNNLKNVKLHLFFIKIFNK